MNILITGGAGYIGSELTEYLLRDGHRVTCYDNLMFEPTSLLRYTNNPNFFFVKGDVRDLNLLKKHTTKADVIIPFLNYDELLNNCISSLIKEKCIENIFLVQNGIDKSNYNTFWYRKKII